MVQVIETSPSGAGKRIAIAVSRFNEVVSARLLQGATRALLSQGTAESDIIVVWVPGSFELPLTCKWLADSGEFDAVVALGNVIRGATSHYEHVCNQAARGILDTGLATSVPIAFGVLTCETLDQALQRAGSTSGNKGADVAMAALEMISVKHRIDAV